ncbi:MAG: 23S rRNA (guanosine(2251)-2'-O)-methyltransferase RlmB [Clostridia bacterium]|nr:23S rRNA (guanosine(2251)-2'-O)-methyltransferase RlmB [Clostridia bacterium]
MLKIEGRNAVREAILNGTTIEKIIASNGVKDNTFNEIIKLAKDKKIKIQFVDNVILNQQSKTGKHQGLIAISSDFSYSSVDDIIKNKHKEDNFILILDGIEDPHNFGSIVRVCECFGVDGIIIGKNRACPVNETVIKTSAGATSYVKIAKVTNINDTIKKLQENNIWVYACELGGQDINKTNFSGNCAIVIGSEGFGTSALTKKLCDTVVTIPMCGKINSLNASVATGIAINTVYTKKFLK